MNYNTIGDGCIEFLEKLGTSAKFGIKTTINPMGYDRSKSEDSPQSFQERQENITSSCERMGAAASFTCSPHEVIDLPEKGTVISFAEAMLQYFQTRF